VDAQSATLTESDALARLSADSPRVRAIRSSTAIARADVLAAGRWPNPRLTTNFREAVERGAQERVVPILMTAMAAGLALIPLALGGGKSGSEIQTPMAVVILCGLVTSTLLNMIVVPTLYLKYGRASGTAPRT
jgi:Cu/Ag efflux pump CusA